MKKTLLIISFLANILFFCQEILQIKDQGLKNYFKIPKNYIDFSVFWVYLLFFIMRMNYPGTLIPSEYVNEEISGNNINIFTFMVILNIIVLLQVAMKVLFFLKVNDKFGILIELIIECVGDIAVFGTFMIGWIIVFTCIFILLGAEFDNEDYGVLPKGLYFVL